jgi:predicted ATPase/DNA-binding CsgD family transcriptional regulator
MAMTSTSGSLAGQWPPARRQELPAGSVTFMTADVADYASLTEATGAADIARHLELVAAAAEIRGGVRHVDPGRRDLVVTRFASASAAVAAALDLQLAMAAESWAGPRGPRVRMALHTGQTESGHDGVDGAEAIARCSRILALAHGGQTLLSEVTRDAVIDDLPAGATLAALGSSRPSDVGSPGRVWQLCHPYLSPAFPWLGSQRLPSSNLPVQLTSLVGREREVSQLALALRENRLVTVTGAGGCGKTRLASQCAVESAEYRDGPWWVALGPLVDPALVGLTVAGVLGLQKEAGRAIRLTLVEQLQHLTVLLVLDNAEHVLDETASLVEQLLIGAPGVRFLVTSREPLGVQGEVTWRVPPLGREAAEQLFVDRARLVRPGFEPDEEQQRVIRGLCSRLDGLPLAIELAASRVRMMSPAQIAVSLDDRFRLLTGSARGAVPRQRTLEASVTWSYDLLSDPERTLLRRLSVFAGGFTAAAAEAVGASGDVGHEAVAVLDLLGRLVDKSLVQADDAADTRYQLLETVRDFADARLLEAAEGNATRDAHLAYFVAHAEHVAPNLPGSESPVWLASLDRDRHNLQTAMEWADRSGDEQSLRQLIVALGLFWELRHSAIGVRWLRRAVARDGDSSLLWAKVLWQSAHMGVYGDDLESTARRAPEAVAAAAATGDAVTVARALNTANYCAAVSNPPAARAALARSVELCRAAGDDWGAADGLKMATIACLMQGDDEGLRETTDELWGLAEAMGNTFFLAWCHSARGYAAVQRGETGPARDDLETAVALCRQIGDPLTAWLATVWLADLDALAGNHAAARAGYADTVRRAGASGGTASRVWGIIGLGHLLREEGDALAALAVFEPAAPRFAGADPLWRSLFYSEYGAALLDSCNYGAAQAALAEGLAAGQLLANPYLIALAQHHLARAATARGDLMTAGALHHASLALRVRAGLTPGVLESVEALAALAAEQRSAAEAARLLAATSAARASLGLPRSPAALAAVSQALALARAGLDDDAYTAAGNEGSALTLAAATAYATRGRGGRKRPSSGWASLTPTELQVVRLAAEGLSNPEIASRLFITRGTVKTHLTHIFAKLGLTTRAGLAAEATRRSA